MQNSDFFLALSEILAPKLSVLGYTVRAAQYSALYEVEYFDNGQDLICIVFEPYDNYVDALIGNVAALYWSETSRKYHHHSHLVINLRSAGLQIGLDLSRSYGAGRKLLSGPDVHSAVELLADDLLKFIRTRDSL